MFKNLIKYLLIITSLATAVWLFLGLFTSAMDYSAESLIIGLGIFLASEIGICTSYLAAKIENKK